MSLSTLYYSRLLTKIPILAIFQNLRWNSNKTSLLSSPDVHTLVLVPVDGEKEMIDADSNIEPSRCQITTTNIPVFEHTIFSQIKNQARCVGHQEHHH